MKRASGGIDLRLSENLYLAAFIVLILKFMLSSSLLLPWPDIINTVSEGLFLCLISLKLLSQRYTAVQLISGGILLALSVYSSLNARFTSPVLSLLLVLSLQDVDLRRILRISYSLKAAVLLIHVLCYIILLAIGSDSITYSYRDETARHYFMLGHPNMFSSYVLWTFIEYLYANYDRIRARHIALFLLINIVFFSFTDSRTGLYTCIALSVFICFDKIGSRLFHRALTFIAKYGFGICSAVCIALTAVYTPSLSGRARELWLTLNTMLTGRLVFGAYAYHNFGFTWLGRTLNMPSKVYYNGYWMDGVIFDNSYQWLFLVYGTAFLIIISLALFLKSRHLNSKERIIIFAYVMYSIMENYAVNVVVCFPLLILGKYFYAVKQRKIAAPNTVGEDPFPLWKRKNL